MSWRFLQTNVFCFGWSFSSRTQSHEPSEPFPSGCVLELVWKYTDFSVHHFGETQFWGPFGSASPSEDDFQTGINLTMNNSMPQLFTKTPLSAYIPHFRLHLFPKNFELNSWNMQQKTVREGCGYVEKTPVSLSSPKLTVRTWKLMIGRPLPFWQGPVFSFQVLRFREDTLCWNQPVVAWHQILPIAQVPTEKPTSPTSPMEDALPPFEVNG